MIAQQISRFLLLCFIPILRILIQRHKKQAKTESVSVCSILCHRDVLRYLYSLYFFSHYCHSNFSVTIIHDGSLTKFDLRLLSWLYNSSIFHHSESGKIILKQIQNFPHIYNYRFKNNSYPYRFKFDALLLSQNKKVIYFDADILFNQTPTELINWMKSSVSTGLYTGYDMSFWEQRKSLEDPFRKLLFHHKKITPILGFNSGFLCFAEPIGQLQLKYFDEVLELFDVIGSSDDLLSEERMFALHASKFHSHCLPIDTYVNICLKDHLSENHHYQSSIMTHYAYLTKDVFYRAAVSNLMRVLLNEIG